MSNSNIDLLDQMSVEQKFARAILDLRNLRPFYSSIFTCMKKEKANDRIPTMAVSIDTLFYNTNFIDSITYGEFLFVVLHEIAHVALQHVSRLSDLDPVLGNIAADYYVNALIAQEFGFDLDYVPQTYVTEFGVEITFPKDALALSSVDVDEDSTESLYYKLLKEEQKQNGSGDDDDSSGDGDDNGSGDDSNTYTYKIRGSKAGGGANSVSDLVIDKNSYQPDLIKSSKSKEEQSTIVEDLLVRAKTSHEMMFPGEDTGLLLSKVLKSLKSKVNWKNVLKQYLRAATQSDTSYATPDKRFMYQSRLILPGQYEDDLSKIEGVKICIDVSGSISEQDLAEFLGQVWAICKSFKVSAEVLYWDTVITSKGTFTGYKEFERVDQIGGGGTDPACLFEYFNSKECKDMPIVNLIFTDGYVGNGYDTPLNKRKYGKNTIWIMSKNAISEDYAKNINFPAFGRLIYPEWKK